MKYSMECLDEALLKILPYSDKWPKSINRPTRMDMVAKQVFLNGTGTMANYDLDCAVHVIREALQELNAEGWMTFGKKNIFED